VAAGEGLDEALELADVALEARAQRRAARQVLGEERRRVGGRAVDRRAAADDQRAQPGELAAGRQQLGSGNWTMSWWTTTCGAAALSVRARSAPLRRSAST
jgi:hypothetical protein